MNRSILIVICDFLLLSLLTFSTDINKMADEDTSRSAKVEVATNEVVNAGKDLADVMKLALEEERKERVELQQRLRETLASASRQQAQLSRSEQENQAVQQQFAAAQASVKTLKQQLQENSAQSQQIQQRLATVEMEKQEQITIAETLRRQLDEQKRKAEATQTEKQQLARQLQLAEIEKHAAAERAAFMQDQVKAERAQNARLAEGLNTLATNSGALTREIRENRALAPNTIFSEFLANRIEASLTATRPGFLHMGGTHESKAETVLVTDGTNIFALCHVDDTPLTLYDPGTDWNGLTGNLVRNTERVPVGGIYFHAEDPRVVMLPVSDADAGRLGCKIYRISSSPYKFQDAVLVGADNGYYGECNFQIQQDMPQYVKLDRSFLRGLVGKFNPSRGDLVFSRTGELLGVMVNGTYCLMVHNFSAAATLVCGPDVRDEHTGATLARLYGYVFALPLRLQ